MRLRKPISQTIRCPHCSAELPQEAQFCIECGQPQGNNTIQLPNARVAQSVIGGTIKLATSGAVPPGIWSESQAPGSADVIAVYAPLRAIVAGWSAVTQMGWQLVERGPRAHAEASSLYRFACERDWFPIPGAADNLRLRIRLEALAEAEPGRTRQGFRYRIGHDAPMSVVDAYWHTASDHERIELPIPQIQIMAPPRVARISDFNEQVQYLPELKALEWARQGQLPEFLHFERDDVPVRLIVKYTNYRQFTGNITVLPDDGGPEPKPVPGKSISIRFDANTGGGIPWQFAPEKVTRTVTIGARNIAFYKATNMSAAPITGTAVYNVSPSQAGQYFVKVQCFCFTEQTLQPGQTVDMPVTYYVDPAILDDPDARDISEITLSYTFYPHGPSAASSNSNQ